MPLFDSLASVDNTAIALVVLSTGAAALYLIVKSAYPKPIPGIPYNAESARRLFGDMPGVIKAVKETGDPVVYYDEQAAFHKSPIFQVFLLPFTSPNVVICDHREIRDIMVHRIKEFDRSNNVINAFEPILGDFQFVLKTNDSWKMHRRLVQDTMTPVFLRNVAAPNLYVAFERLVSLWQRKVDLASGRPFSVVDDMSAITFDGVLAFVFGSDFPHSATKPQEDALQGLISEMVTGDLGKDDAVHFPVQPIHPDIECMSKLTDQMEKAFQFPDVKIGWYLFGKTSEFYRMKRRKTEVIKEQIQKAVRKKAKYDQSGDEDWIKHAVDHIVKRESRLADREGRTPDFEQAALVDELYGIIVAGHDTTATAMAWAIKILVKYPHVQQKLRKVLQEAYPEALKEKRSPTREELMDVVPPYAEAFMSEALRYQSPVPINGRTATCDTTILGYPIPKGCNVSTMTRGPSYRLPSYAASDSVRTASCVKDDKTSPMLDADDMGEFKPERWFVTKQGNGEKVYDAAAWPNPSFGFGLRSCFGRRLAYLEYRILLTMIVWNFEFLDTPEELSTWGARVSVTYRPRQCYIRAAKVDL